MLGMTRVALWSAVVALATAVHGELTITKNIQLSEDTDWSAEEMVTIADGVVLDLAGHSLKVAGLAGSGTITSSVAAVYHRLEYLQNDYRSYIDTGYSPVPSTTTRMRLRFYGNLPKDDGWWRTIFGSYHDSYNGSYYGIFVYKENGKNYFWKSLDVRDDNWTANCGEVVTGYDYYFRLDKDGPSQVNGCHLGNGASGTCAGSAFLFGMRSNGSLWGSSGNEAAGQQLYYCTFTEGETVVHDFVPARRLFDNKLGLYDLVTGDFKTNAGEGEFSGGREIPEQAFATGELHLVPTAYGTWNCSQLKVASDVAVVTEGGVFEKDVDWRALGTVFIASGDTINLNGQVLKVAGLGGNGTVTDSLDGELHLVVPEGVEVDNRSVSFQGTMRLVKDGPGAFVASRPKQLYSGGTQVAGGEFRCICSNYGNYDEVLFYGAENSEIVVDEGAVMNFDGSGNHCTMNFVLNGGEIRSQVGHGMAGQVWVRSLRLTADSKMSGFDFGFVESGAAAMTVDLGGHTLTLDIPGDRSFLVANTTFTGGGRLVADSSGWLNLGHQNKACTFEEGTALEVGGTALNVIASTLVEGTYMSYATHGFDNGSGTLQIAGRFVPCSANFHNVTMMNGSVLDLNGRNEALVTPCSLLDSLRYGQLAVANGATVTVDISEREPELNEKLVVWQQPPAGANFQFDETTALKGVPPVAVGGGLYYGFSEDSRIVDQAWWTGAAGDGVVGNPANWACTNAAGRVVTEGLPDRSAVVHIRGDATLQIPVGATIEYSMLDIDGLRLTGDCDWRGMGTSLTISGTVDLHGHQLQLRRLCGNGTITDSWGNGELIVEVPAEQTENLETITLTGGLKLIKEGEGTLVAKKKNQSYTGGNEIRAGIAKSPCSDNTETWSEKYLFWGAQGATIQVNAGAKFDTQGNYGFKAKTFVLAGGTLVNDGCDMSFTDRDGMGNLQLTADSTLECPYLTLLNCNGIVNLGGHTLTVIGGEAGGIALQLGSCSFANGMLQVVTDGAWFKITKSIDMRTVDLRCNGALYFSSGASTLDVHDYEAKFAQDINHGKTVMNVYGTFTPSSQYYYACVLQDGSRLDLGEYAGTFSTTGAFHEGVTGLKFADNATITLRHGPRTVRQNLKVVDWADNAPANLSTLKFTLERAERARGLGLWVKSDGIYLQTGLALYFR